MAGVIKTKVKIVNEFILDSWIAKFLENEWQTTIIQEWDTTKQLFLSLQDQFDIDIFSAWLDNIYKYMGIENTFYYKYLYMASSCFCSRSKSYCWSRCFGSR